MQNEQTISNVNNVETVEKSKKEIATEPLIKFNNDLDKLQNKSSESIRSGNIHENNVAELIVTKSGALALELSDEVFEKINKKCEHSSDLFVSLNKTKSGHCMLDFDPPQNQSIVRIAVKKTPSGNFTLEINKKLVDDWFPSDSYSESNYDTENTQSSLSIEVTKKKKRRREKQGKENSKREKNRDKLQQQRKTEKEETIEQKHLRSGTTEYGKKGKKPAEDHSHDNNLSKPQSDMGYRDEISVEDIIQKKCNTSTALTTEDYKDEFHKLWMQNKKNVSIKVYASNGVKADVEAKLTKTLSGKLALDVTNISSIGEISHEDKEFPVLLRKTFNDKYILFVGLRDNSVSPNSVLRKTPSGETLVVITKPVLTSTISNKDTVNNMTNDKLFKVQVKESSNDLIETPALLKSTNSDNYIIVLNKEFEKQHRNSLGACLGEDKECFIEIRETKSDTVIINFVQTPFDSNKPHALLVRSPSDNFKVIVNGTVFENKLQNLDSKKAFEELFSKSNEYKTMPFNNTINLVDVKSCSDSNILNKIKLQLQNKTGLLSDPSTVLKRTPSGRYAIVLDKETKKSFINDLKTYLTSTSHGRVPIKKTDTGEITIFLNESDDGKSQYGSLRISPSGNIYIMVNDNLIRDTNNARLSLLDRIIGKNNKAASTTSESQPEGCICEPTKCICEELKKNRDEWLKNVNGSKISLNEQEKTLYHSDKDCDPLYCIKIHCSSKEDIRPHIVIKPGQGHEESEPYSKAEQCYYVFDSVCPLHKGRYETVSNEIIEISGLCTVQNKVSDTSDSYLDASSGDISEKSKWDSLSYLPPQLPPFLRDHLLMFKYSK